MRLYLEYCVCGAWWRCIRLRKLVVRPVRIGGRVFLFIASLILFALSRDCQRTTTFFSSVVLFLSSPRLPEPKRTSAWKWPCISARYSIKERIIRYPGSIFVLFLVAVKAAHFGESNKGNTLETRLPEGGRTWLSALFLRNELTRNILLPNSCLYSPADRL